MRRSPSGRYPVLFPVSPITVMPMEVSYPLGLHHLLPALEKHHYQLMPKYSNARKHNALSSSRATPAIAADIVGSRKLSNLSRASQIEGIRVVAHDEQRRRKGGYM